MKVLYVSEYWQPKVMGGGEISGSLMAENLTRAGVDVSVLTSHFKGLPEQENDEGVRVFRRLITGENPQSPASNLERILCFTRSVEKEVVRLDKEEDFDLIHALNITSLAGVAGVKEKIKKPIVAHINSPTPFCPRGVLMKGDKECAGNCGYGEFSSCMREHGNVSRMNTPFYLKYNPLFARLVYRNYLKRKEALQKFDRFMPLSSFMKKMLVSYGIPEERIEVVPNIIETRAFFAVKPVDHDPPGILYLGPYSEYKGPQILLSALKGLKAGYFCDCYGSGRLEGMLKDYVKKEGLTSVKINPEVPHPQVPFLYQSHDILVFPSLVSEAFGRVSIEAMAAGRPVIASGLGGIMDVVEDGVTGLLVKPGDAVGLKEALEKLLSDGSLRQGMGKRGREKVEKSYNAEAITKKILQVYAAVAR